MGCMAQRCAGSGAVDAPFAACTGNLVDDETSHGRCIPRAQVEVLADKNGGLMRLLGVEIGTPDSTTEPRCHRFAAIVEDGILLKLVGAGGSYGEVGQSHGSGGGSLQGRQVAGHRV